MTFYFVCPLLSSVRFCHQITLLHNVYKHIVNIMKVHIKRNNLQLQLMRYLIKKMLTLFTFTFAK